MGLAGGGRAEQCDFRVLVEAAQRLELTSGKKMPSTNTAPRTNLGTKTPRTFVPGSGEGPQECRRTKPVSRATWLLPVEDYDFGVNI